MPFQFLFPFIFSSIVYWMIGYEANVATFLFFTLFVILTSLTGSAFGFLVASFFNTIGVALGKFLIIEKIRLKCFLAVAPLVILPRKLNTDQRLSHSIVMLFGGFLVSNETSYSWLVWIQWVSPIQYAFTGMSRVVLSDRTILGDPNGGNTILNSIGSLGRLPPGVDVVILIALYFLLLFLSYIGLYLVVRKGGLSRGALNAIRRKLLAQA